MAKFWYDTMFMPPGVKAVVIADASGVQGIRFEFGLNSEALALIESLEKKASDLRKGRADSLGLAPSEVDESVLLPRVD